ncbi:histidine phosphatase family protein [Corynebacterium macclintockiae]|uniref:histidine phosphatase family protein n=1 Tax=Corynebacterium macclintockiae TaxID=2913501 RepID=UPI003EB70BFD
MGILYLVRHGQANSGGLHTDNVAEGEMEATYDQLTELGHEQARVTGRALAERIGSGSGSGSCSGERPIILSGPLGRQLSTAGEIYAEMVAAGLDPQPVETVEEWREFSSDAVLAPYFRAYPGELAQIRRAYAAARTGHAGQGSGQVAGGMKEHNRLLGQAVDAALRQWRSTPGFASFAAQVRQGFSDATFLAAQHGSVVVVTSAGPISMCAAALIGADWTHMINNIFTSSVSVFSTRGAAASGPAAGAAADTAGTDTAADTAAGTDAAADTAGTDTVADTAAQLLSFNEHAHLDYPDPSGARRLRRYR